MERIHIAERCVEIIDRAEICLEAIDLTVDIGEIAWRRLDDGWAICILDARGKWIEAAEANISLRVRTVELVPQLILAAQTAQRTMLERAESLIATADVFLRGHTPLAQGKKP